MNIAVNNIKPHVPWTANNYNNIWLPPQLVPKFVHVLVNGVSTSFIFGTDIETLDSKYNLGSSL